MWDQLVLQNPEYFAAYAPRRTPCVLVHYDGQRRIVSCRPLRESAPDPPPTPRRSAKRSL